MATTLRVDRLYMQGEPDEEYSITVDRNTYHNLPVFPKSMYNPANCVIEKCTFSEIYRGHRTDPKSYHKAIRIYDPGDTIGRDYHKDKHRYYYCVWVAEEGCWIVFQYKELTTVDDMFNSTVEVCIPQVGEVYRPNDELYEIIKDYDV